MELHFQRSYDCSAEDISRALPPDFCDQYAVRACKVEREEVFSFPRDIFQPLHFKFSTREVLFFRRYTSMLIRRAVKYPIECLANRA